MARIKKPLKKKEIIHLKCGKKHIDKNEWAEKNHSRHLCEYCKEFFFDNEGAVGV